MIRQPATDKPSATLLAIMLAAALAVGFVVGQVAPNVIGQLSAGATIDRQPTAPAAAPALTRNDDYATRQADAANAGIGVGADIVWALTDQDDWALRHRPVPSPAVELTRNDDYATRHSGNELAP